MDKTPENSQSTIGEMSKEFKKSIICQTHNSEKVMVCLEKECEQNILQCVECFQENHESHQWITIKKLKQKTEEKNKKRTDVHTELIKKHEAEISAKSDTIINQLSLIFDVFKSKIESIEDEIKYETSNAFNELKEEQLQRQLAIEGIPKLESENYSESEKVKIIESMIKLQKKVTQGNANTDIESKIEEIVEKQFSYLNNVDYYLSNSINAISESIKSICINQMFEQMGTLLRRRHFWELFAN